MANFKALTINTGIISQHIHKHTDHKKLTAFLI